MGQSLAVEGPQWAFALRVDALHVTMPLGLAAAHGALRRRERDTQTSTIMLLLALENNTFGSASEESDSVREQACDVNLQRLTKREL